ncbi:hypothetical protein [Magnetofaba australis]|uniref:Putative Glycosyl hydrolase family 57 n=1 Tax=Magnetofaba australis IT-1 TaxID=1434232 RepID=A0A1Y2K3Q9_9PROT|nr:hypothetical protein [Magnetofaba australis]OSM03960.1 putative Glycosyl hydrolase family 57 [Magnetofaba australis IT-1]
MPQAEGLQGLGGSVDPKTPWNLYGLESAVDLHAIESALLNVRDSAGRPACITANFILANPDLRRMRREGGDAFHVIPITQGFPEPWDDVLLPEYRRLAQSGVFDPCFHGFTHFSDHLYRQAMRQGGDLANRLRALAERDIPYLASYTPELNFALCQRQGGFEQPMEEAVQAAWFAQGMALFQEAFGRAPLSACFPGYRGDAVSVALAASYGVKGVQWFGGALPEERDGMLHLARNLEFEPALKATDLDAILAQARDLVSAGLPLIISTHSINFISRHVNQRDRSLALLTELLSRLKQAFPDILFSHDSEFVTRYHQRDAEWWRAPTWGERRARLVWLAR